MSEVTAIVFGPPPPGAGDPPGATATLALPHLGALADACRRAATPLVWLLDAAAIASEQTLPTLLEHQDAPAASLPVDARGAPVAAAIGRIDDDDADALLERVSERRVPLRHTPVTSLLVEVRLAVAVAPPDPPRFGAYAGTEWTARLFARQPGMLVPASLVEAPPPATGAPAHALRTARAGAWRRGEAMRETYRAVRALAGAGR